MEITETLVVYIKHSSSRLIKKQAIKVDDLITDFKNIFDLIWIELNLYLQILGIKSAHGETCNKLNTIQLHINIRREPTFIALNFL